MSLSVQLGLLLALLTAFGSVAGFLYKFRGAREAPAVDLRRPLRSSVALFRSPLYALGILIALGSWGLHVGALALAPISLVQSVIAGGLVLLTVVADRLFGIAVTRREWIGVGADRRGLGVPGGDARSAPADSAHSHYDPGTLAIYVGAVAAVGLLLAVRIAASHRARPSPRACCGRRRTPRSRRSARISGHLGVGVLDPPARVRDPGRVADRAAGLGAQPPARRGGAGDRAHERRGEPDDDRRWADRVRRAAAAGNGSSLVVRMLAFVLVIVAAALTPPPLRAAAPTSARDNARLESRPCSS